MAGDPFTRQLVDRPRLLAQANAESQGEFFLRDLTEGTAQGRFKIAVSLDSLSTALNWSYVGLLISAINQDSAEETSLDWARLLLFNLGIEQDEIESLMSSALQQ